MSESSIPKIELSESDFAGIRSQIEKVADPIIKEILTKLVDNQEVAMNNTARFVAIVTRLVDVIDVVEKVARKTAD